MVTYEFEFYTPETEQNYPKRPVVETGTFKSNTEARNFARNWLKQRKAEVLSTIRPWMTKPERREILSVLPLFHVTIGRPIGRNESGEPSYESKRY